MSVVIVVDTMVYIIVGNIHRDDMHDCKYKPLLDPSETLYLNADLDKKRTKNNIGNQILLISKQLNT